MSDDAHGASPATTAAPKNASDEDGNVTLLLKRSAQSSSSPDLSVAMAYCDDDSDQELLGELIYHSSSTAKARARANAASKALAGSECNAVGEDERSLPVKGRDGSAPKEKGARQTCSVAGCNHYPIRGGICIKHGSSFKTCSVADCTH